MCVQVSPLPCYAAVLFDEFVGVSQRALYKVWKSSEDKNVLTAYSITVYRIKKCEQSSLGYLHNFSKDTGHVFS